MKERAFIDITATIIQSIMIVPARGGAAVTSFFCDIMLVKPERKT